MTLKKYLYKQKVYNMLIIREHASAEFNVKAKLVWRMFTFFVVGFVNNSDFFIFWRKKNQSMCTFILYCTENV